MNPQELHFIEDLGLLVEKSGGSRTLVRVFGYLLLADRPKTLHFFIFIQEQDLPGLHSQMPF